MKESDLYLPLKHFLETKGYEVKGEVKGGQTTLFRTEYLKTHRGNPRINVVGPQLNN